MLSSLLLLSLGLVLVESRPEYQDRIPNGKVVEHPCKPFFLWKGVGHKNSAGGGELNPFGQAFHDSDHSWATVCPLDSDGDGMTNGQELGDPRCVWTPGQQAERVTNITHPGICTPYGSPNCLGKDTWVNCEAGEFKCDAINQPDVKNITLQFPYRPVPAKQTSYLCMNFDLPNDSAYHLIATKPYINNSNVMHHIVVFTCMDSVPKSTEPYECMMSQEGCGQPIALWTLGLDGECLYKDVGYSIGVGGFKRVSMQFHYTNPFLRNDYMDASGMTIYYTATKRQYEAGLLVTGQTDLEIPPGLPSVEVTSTCSSSCTKYIFKAPVKIFSSLSHMHYLGNAEKVERYRNGVKVDDLIDDAPYSYDSPKMRLFDPPIDFQPGDELRTTCRYNTMSKKTTTYFGEGTFDEMCYGLLMFFPSSNRGGGTCNTFRTISSCDVNYGCDRAAITNTSSSLFKNLTQEVLENCNAVGACRPECPTAIERLKQSSPCFQGDMYYYVVSELTRINPTLDGLRLAGALESCACPKILESGATTTTTTTMTYPVDAAWGVHSTPLSVNLIVSFIVFLSYAMF